MEKLIIRFETHEASDGSGVCWYTAHAESSGTSDTGIDVDSFNATGESQLEAAYYLLDKLLQAENDAYEQEYSQRP